MSAAIFRALRRTILGALFLGVFVVVALQTITVHAAPGINQQLNFQGRLLTASGATVPDGYYNIQFKIYQDGTGTVAGNPSGTLKWTESWLNSASAGIQVKNGYMSVQLGSITSLSSVDWNQDTLWLSINVGNTNVSCTPFTSCGSDGEMIPMKRLSSTPYAFNAGKLGGLSSAQFLQLAQGVQTEAANNTASIAINKTGTGGSFLNLQANSVDVFTVANTGDINFGNNIDHAISVTTAAASTAGKALTISAGTAGTGAGALTGGTLVLQGGTGGGTGGNGGNVTLDAGAAASGGTGGTVNIGTTNASAIILGQNTTLTADKSLTITGSGTRPSSPTEGMVYYDTTTKQLIVYSNGKWQSDRAISTKIVAASTSSQAVKDSADYVATGTSDQSIINSALTAAAGGKVYLMEGTYITDDVITIPNNTTLSGTGRNTLIQLGNIDGQTKNMIANTDTTTGEGVVVRDLRLDGNNSVNTTGTMYGIYMNGMGGGSGSTARNGATITGIWVMNTLSDGMRFNGSANGTVTNSTVQGGAANGIYLGSSSRMSMSNNTLQGNAGSGVWFTGSLYNTVTSNVIVANSSGGISLNGSSQSNTIASNNLYSNAGSSTASSISLASVTGNQINGNTIVDTAGAGYAISIDVASSANHLSNNIFSGTGATSISDASTTTTYSSQSRATSGGQLTNRTANDTQAFSVQSASGSTLFAVDSTNSQVVLGNTTTAGKLAISDGSSNTGTIVVGALAGNYTYTIPTTTANDTFCLVTLNNCAANATLFIQNQNTSAQTANYWINGAARADTSVLTPLLDTATGVALNIGTATATSVNIGKTGTVTTVNGKLGVTLDTTDGTTITCRNASGYLSICDASVLTPSASNFIQNSTTIQTTASFWIDGTGKASGGLQTGNIDSIGSGGSLNIGTSNAGSLAIGKTGVTTTIQGNIGVTLNATTGTTQVCRNATGLLSSCDVAYLAPTTTNFIQNQASTPGTAQSGNFNITGTGIAGTLQAANVVATTFDTATGVALNIGTSGAPTTTAINLNQSVTVAAGKSLTIIGSGSRPLSPTEGMLYYDTTTKHLLIYANGKWQADRTEAVIVAASNSSQADKDAADYVADGDTAAAADGDQVQINAALTAGAGKKVILLAGTYVVDDSVGIPNNTTLAGVGQGTILELADLDANINLIYNIDQSTATAVVIRDMKLNGRNDLNTAGNQGAINLHNLGNYDRLGATVQGLLIVNFRSDGIRLLGVSNTTITGNTFAGITTNGSSAIYDSYTEGNTYTGNTFSNNYWGLRTDNSSHDTMTNNFFYNNNTGVTSNNAAQNAITSNTFSGNATDIDLYQVTTTIVSNNVATDNGWRSIALDTSSNNTITGNNIQNSGGATVNNAIYLTVSDSNTITGNTITDSSATSNNYAINIFNSTSDTNYLTGNTIGAGSINNAGTGTIYGGQLNSSGNYVIQPAGTIELMKNTNVTGTLSASTTVLSPNIDRASAGTLTIGTNATNTTALTIGSSGVTTTIQGNTGVTLNATTGTTQVCRNASGVLSTCDAGYLAPTATNFIQNGSSQQASSNFNISGTGVATTFQAATSVLTPLLDAATSSTVLNIGTTNASAINLNQNVTVLAGKSLTIAGSGTRPSSPVEGTLYYDTTTKQMIQWNGTKWVNNGSDAYLVAANNSSQADKDAADYVATGTGDQSTIQSAIDRADPASAISGARKSGKVYLFAGTYTTNDVISIPNDTTLSGAGRGSIIKFANINGQTKNMITNADTTTGKGVTVRDLQLDGSSSVNTSGTMYGIYFNGMGGAAGATARQGANIINNWVNSFFSNGIYLNGSPNSTIIGNNVQGNTGNGIYISSSNRSNITNNISQGNGGSGIVLAGAISENVVANTFAVNGTAGVYINGGSNNNTIFGNNFYNNGGANNNAILFPVTANGDFNTITNNTINDTSGTTSNFAINFVDTTSNNNYLADNVFTSTAGTSTINDAPANNTVYANQPRGEAGAKLTNRTVNDTEAFAIQNAGGTNVLAVDTTNNKVLVAGTLDTTTATTLNIGTATASAVSIGRGAITTTIAGNTGVTLNGTTGAAMVCRNASGLLSACDIATTAGFIQNQNAGAQTTSNFWISGTGQAATLTAGTVNATTSLVTSTVDTVSGVALTLGGTTASSVDVGKSAGIVNLKANSTLIGTAAAAGNITLQGAAQTVAATAGNQFILKGSTGSTTGAGGQLTLQGGDGGATSGANGGNVYISGGTGTGTGVNGLVLMTTPTFSTVTNDANCFTGGAPVAADCTVAAASVNGSSAVLVGFSTSAKTAILPDPTIATAGRVIYVTASNTSEDFTLYVNGGGQGNQIAMRKNTTATMIWNGADWTAAGASSSTTLQASYDNTLQSAGGAELVVSKTSATNGFTIRDSSTNSVNGALLTIQSSSAANLFSVNSNVREYTTDSGAEVAGASANTFPTSTWVNVNGSGTSTIARYTTTGTYVATGQGSVSVATTGANDGVKNILSTTLTPNMHYNVSFTTRLASGTFTDMVVDYSKDGTVAGPTSCATSQTSATSIWTKVNCTFTAPSSGITSSNAIIIRQATGVSRTFYVDNISVTIAADYNLATDGGVDDNTNFTTNWTAAGGASVTRSTTSGNDASDSAQAITTGSNQGVRNKLSMNPLPSTMYRVTAYVNISAGSFTTFTAQYSRDGGTSFVGCADYNTQTITNGSSYTKVTCYVTTDSTAATNPYVYFTQTDGTGRTFNVDTFSMNLSSNTTPNVQVGGGVNGGPTTLFTLDRGASAPIASNNDALLGSMYYDTTLGKLQCYEADGWGACGSSPDNIITISPEYTNAVLHGTGIGTMTSDLCTSNASLHINDGTSGQPTICGANETYNFYKWTSPQNTSQTYSIYVTYQLPNTFKSFNSGQTSLMGRTDNGSNGGSATVQYTVYRNSASGLTACGTATTVSTGTVASWQVKTASGSADPSTCGFSAGNSIVFKIDVTTNKNANAYVSNLNFAFSNT